MLLVLATLLLAHTQRGQALVKPLQKQAGFAYFLAAHVPAARTILWRWRCLPRTGSNSHLFCSTNKITDGLRPDYLHGRR